MPLETGSGVDHENSASRTFLRRSCVAFQRKTVFPLAAVCRGRWSGHKVLSPLLAEACRYEKADQLKSGAQSFEPESRSQCLFLWLAARQGGCSSASFRSTASVLLDCPGQWRCRGRVAPRYHSVDGFRCSGHFPVAPSTGLSPIPSWVCRRPSRFGLRVQPSGAATIQPHCFR